PADNSYHAYRTGLNPSRRAVRKCQDGQEFHSVTEAARVTGIDASLICKSCKNSGVRAGGLQWEYVDQGRVQEPAGAHPFGATEEESLAVAGARNAAAVLNDQP